MLVANANTKVGFLMEMPRGQFLMETQTGQFLMETQVHIFLTETEWLKHSIHGEVDI